MLAAATSAHAAGAHAAEMIDDDPITSQQTLRDATINVPASAFIAFANATLMALPTTFTTTFPPTFLSSRLAIGRDPFNLYRPPMSLAICLEGSLVGGLNAVPGPAS